MKKKHRFRFPAKNDHAFVVLVSVIRTRLLVTSLSACHHITAIEGLFVPLKMKTNSGRHHVIHWWSYCQQRQQQQQQQQQQPATKCHIKTTIKATATATSAATATTQIKASFKVTRVTRRVNMSQTRLTAAATSSRGNKTSRVTHTSCGPSLLLR